MSQDADPIDRVRQRLHAVLGGWGADTSYAEMRRQWDALFKVRHQPAASERLRAGGVDATWISAPGVRADCALMYLHGGGYVMGSVNSHWDLIAGLSASAGCRVLALDYRLAPEHPYPAAIEDAESAYRWLLEQGIPSGGIAIAGDSAGAGLAATLLLALWRSRMPMPAAAVLMSPWVDFEAAGASFDSRKEFDPLVRRRLIHETARVYLAGKVDRRDPQVALLHADLRGLPPLLIQVGDHETLLDDSRSLAEQAQLAGVDVTLEVWDRMIHVFQLFAEELPESRGAIESAGAFLHRHLNRPR